CGWHPAAERRMAGGRQPFEVRDEVLPVRSPRTLLSGKTAGAFYREYGVAPPISRVIGATSRGSQSQIRGMHSVVQKGTEWADLRLAGNERDVLIAGANALHSAN